jgi:transposase
MVMGRPPKNPLRHFKKGEKTELKRISRSHTENFERVARAKALLAVSQGYNYQEAAFLSGRRSDQAVSNLVLRFNQRGLDALNSLHGGGFKTIYGPKEKQQILDLVSQQEAGLPHWSISLIQASLEKTPLGRIGRQTIWRILRDEGYGFQKSRTWIKTGKVMRKRNGKLVEVEDVDKNAKKKIINEAYTLSDKENIQVWCEDEAGPYQAIPHPGYQWNMVGCPLKQPHEYVKGEPVRLLTLFYPKTGYIIGKGVKNCPNTILHPWLEEKIEGILEQSSGEFVCEESKEERNEKWKRWQKGLKMPFTLPTDLPPLKMLLILDNLKGHKTPSFVLWLVEHGVMPLYTPLAGSWLNMAESIQNIIKRRALQGQHPKNAKETIRWLEAAVASWNRCPTPFTWNGKRAERRKRMRDKLKSLKGSGAMANREKTNHYVHAR